MKFGLMAPYGRAPLEGGAYTKAFAQLAEEMGFESIWAVDHVVMCPDYASRYPYDPSGRSPFDPDVIQPDPLQWLGWAAAHTEHIKLGTGILILPQRNPLVLAKSVASLDALSGGRVLLGVGVGWVREESEALGYDFGTRGARCDEYIESMRALWREPVASYAGEHVSFSRVVSRPRPPGGAVPIHIGGHSRAAARRAGRLGDGFYPLGVQGDALRELLGVMAETARAHGRDAAEIEITSVGALDPGIAAAYAHQGVHRMLVSPPTGDLDALQRKLALFRDAAIGRPG